MALVCVFQYGSSASGQVASDSPTCVPQMLLHACNGSCDPILQMLCSHSGCVCVLGLSFSGAQLLIEWLLAPGRAVDTPIYCRELNQVAFKGPFWLEPFFNSVKISHELAMKSSDCLELSHFPGLQPKSPCEPFRKNSPQWQCGGAGGAVRNGAARSWGLVGKVQELADGMGCCFPPSGRGVSEGIGDVLSREKMLTSVILFQTLWSRDIQWFYEADGGPPYVWKEVAVRRVAVAFLRWEVRVWGNSLMLHWGFFITGVWNNFLKEGCSSIEMGCSEKCWVPIPEGI